MQTQIIVPDGTQDVAGATALMGPTSSFYPGSQFPQADTNMYGAMPSTASSIISGGSDMTGQSMPTVYTNISLVSWDPEVAAFATDTVDGAFQFRVTNTRDKIDYGLLLNLFSINTMLAKGYAQAIEMVDTKLTRTEQDELLQTPTLEWAASAVVLEILKRNTGGNHIDSLKFLVPELFMDKFYPYGWCEGTQPDFSMTRQRAVRVYGLLDNVECVWSDDLKPGEDLYFIFTRVYNRHNEKYGQYAYIPWSGFTIPPQSVLEYVDITNTERYAPYVYVGRFLQWVENEKIYPENVQASIGLTGAHKTELPHKQSRSMRISVYGGQRLMRFPCF